jgi:dimethylhistidine N-methyltransferase
MKPHLGSNYVKTILSSNCTLIKTIEKKEQNFAKDVAYGLTRKEKFIPSKYFYDKTGSELFDKICDLPEYYLTRKELEILDAAKQELSECLDGDYSVVELGSGSAVKTRHLFEVLCKSQEKINYYPIDISSIVKESSQRLQDEFDNLQITGIVDQYENGLDLVKDVAGKKIIVFFGSSIGNFDQKSAQDFLRKVRNSMKPGDLFLLGLDLVKGKKILEAAYNDSEGVTRDFNLNLLRRINYDLRGDLDYTNFEHVAFYNSKEKRIEMHIRSKTRQQISIRDIDLFVELEKGEIIRTEYSHKYTIQQIRKMAKRAELTPVRIWQDEQNYFALVLFSV